MTAKHPAHPYTDTAAPWPFDVPPVTLDSTLRYVLAHGVVEASMSIDLLPPFGADRSTSEYAAAQQVYLTNFYSFSGAFNLVLALKALAELSPAKAEEVAQHVMVAYAAGDSYGEWLWQWATEQGLDPEKLVAEHRACPNCSKAIESAKTVPLAGSESA